MSRQPSKWQQRRRAQQSGGPVVAGALVRVSLDKAKHFGKTERWSDQTQADRIRQYCDARGWVLPVEYVEYELDVSGRTTPLEERHGLQRLMALAREGKIQRLVVWWFARFSRNVAQTLQAVELLNSFAQPVPLISIEDGVDTSSDTGRMLCTVLAAIHQYQAELGAMQVFENWTTIAKSGRRPPGRRPWGFDLGQGRRPIPRPGEYEHLIHVHEILADTGSVAQAIQYLRTHGATFTGRGTPTPGTLRMVLANPAYDTADTPDGPRGIVALGDEIHPAEWPPLVPADLRIRARTVLLGRQTGQRERLSPHPLAGLVRCQACGHRYNWRPGRGDYGRCNGMGIVGCHAPPLDAITLQAELDRFIGDLLRHPARITALQETAAQSADADIAETTLRALRAERAKREEQMARLLGDVTSLLSDALPEHRARIQQQAIVGARQHMDRLAEMEAEIRRLEVEVQRPTRHSFSADLAINAAELWPDIPVAERARIYGVLGGEIVVVPRAHNPAQVLLRVLRGAAEVDLHARQVGDRRLYVGPTVNTLDYRHHTGRGKGPQGGAFWTDKQERFIIHTYGRFPRAVIAARLGRAEAEVKTKAAALRREGRAVGSYRSVRAR